VLAHLTENERIIFPDSLSCLAYHESTNFCEILQPFLAIFTLNCATDTMAKNNSRNNIEYEHCSPHKI
ncbi:hypothetical protein, partial [Lutibacter sp.]|uniref:hypothetical protein n=1 Tax=Lutibacter sp. TaxID=1925666 RepID=UPI002732DE98